jgi:predicted transcriptional regulator
VSPIPRENYDKLREQDELQEVKILDFLRGHPSAVTTEIAAELQIPLNTTLVILKELEKEGKVMHTNRSGMFGWTAIVQKKRKGRNRNNRTKTISTSDQNKHIATAEVNGRE